MNSPFKFLTATEVAERSGGAVSYIRILTACRNEEISCQKIGPSYVIPEEDALAFIAKYKELADPELVSRLQAEIGRLKLEVESLKARVQAC